MNGKLLFTPSEEITETEQKSSWKWIDSKKILIEDETEMAKKILIITWTKNEIEIEIAKNKISSYNNLNWSSRHWSSGWNALEETSG